jgi:hypothetical protein
VHGKDIKYFARTIHWVSTDNNYRQQNKQICHVDKTPTDLGNENNTHLLKQRIKTSEEMKTEMITIIYHAAKSWRMKPARGVPADSRNVICFKKDKVWLDSQEKEQKLTTLCPRSANLLTWVPKRRKKSSVAVGGSCFALRRGRASSCGCSRLQTDRLNKPN